MKNLIFLFFLSSNVFANDAVSSLTLEGIVFSKTDAISLRKEKLFLSPNEIKVDYIFENTTSIDQTLLVSFPLPPIGANYGDNSERFESFTVTIDGKDVSYQTECRAFNESVELTEELKQAGLPICEFKNAKELSKKTQALVIKKKLYSTDNMDEELNPTFTISRKHYWSQNFLPKQKIHVQHRYKPLLGMNSIGQLSHDWQEFLPQGALSFCLDMEPSKLTSENKAICQKELKDPQIDTRASYLRYIITSANTWKNGIEYFEMIATGAAIVLGEVDGARDADFKELKLIKKNFKPKKEILIEFVGENKDPIIPKGLTFLKIIDGPANCRSKPDGEIVTSVPNLEKVNVRERKGNWYRIDFKGKECWTKRNNLKFNFNHIF